MPKKNAFYAQSGGVTAVINASACGLIETARKHKDKIGKVYAGRDGIIGALTEELIDTSKESARAIAALRHTPGGHWHLYLSVILLRHYNHLVQLLRKQWQQFYYLFLQDKQWTLLSAPVDYWLPV